MEQELNGQSASVRVGAALKSAREHSGMSLGEVAERLKLSIRQLQAIENDDFQQLPGATFVRGFVRNYARFLQLDPEPLMQALEQHFPSAVNDVVNLARHDSTVQPPSMAETLAKVGHPRSRHGRWWGLGLLVLAVVALAAWQLHQEKLASVAEQTLPVASEPLATLKPASAAAAVLPALQQAAASQPQASAALPSAAVASVAAAPASGAVGKSVASAAEDEGSAASAKLQLSASQAAWISVIDANGKKLQFGTLAAGERKELSGTPPLQLKIGNASQVTLSFNGQPVDLTDKIRGTTAKIELK